MLHACVSFSDSGGAVRRLRVLAGTARLYPELQRLGSNFTSASGVPLYFNYSTRVGSNGAVVRAAIARPPPIVDTPDASGGVDAFIVSPAYMWNMAQAGKLLDLGPLVAADHQLNWISIKKVLREQMVVYGNKVVAIPVTTSPVFLFYHAPTFARDGLQVPLTWDQVVALAGEYNGKDINGDGQPDYGFCMTPSGCFVDGTMLSYIFSSFVQTHGSSQGLLLDPLTLAPLANTSAMVEALEVMRQLRRVGPSNGSCAVFEDQMYLQGRCLMSMSTPVTWKAAYSPEAPAAYGAMRGNMGIAAFPGSTRVLDRTTGRMAPCDNTRCPLATATALDADGVVRPVNQPVPSNNVIVMINAQSEPKYQYYAYSLFSYLSSPHVLGTRGTALLLDPRLETAPLRDADLQPDSLDMWVKHGYDREDVAGFFRAYRAAVDNPNHAFESKFPGNLNVTMAMTLAAVAYTNVTPGATQLPAFVALSIINRAIAGVIAEQGGPEAFAAVYRQTLNWVAPAGAIGADGGGNGDGSGGGNGQERTVAVAVAVPCGVAVMAAVGALVVWVVWRRRRRARGKGIEAAVTKAPGAGPDTTLLVTDIQSSTSLWEHLDAAAMDRAMFLHHSILRRAIAGWRGYESATEGDSFIVAFANPTDALMCALAAQQSLLEAPWPPELLSPPPLPGLGGELDPLMPLAVVPVAPNNRQGQLGAGTPAAAFKSSSRPQQGTGTSTRGLLLASPPPSRAAPATSSNSPFGRTSDRGSRGPSRWFPPAASATAVVQHGQHSPPASLLGFGFGSRSRNRIRLDSRAASGGSAGHSVAAAAAAAAAAAGAVSARGATSPMAYPACRSSLDAGPGRCEGNAPQQDSLGSTGGRTRVLSAAVKATGIASGESASLSARLAFPSTPPDAGREDLSPAGDGGDAASCDNTAELGGGSSPLHWFSQRPDLSNQPGSESPAFAQWAQDLMTPVAEQSAAPETAAPAAATAMAAGAGAAGAAATTERGQQHHVPLSPPPASITSYTSALGADLPAGQAAADSRHRQTQEAAVDAPSAALCGAAACSSVLSGARARAPLGPVALAASTLLFQVSNTMPSGGGGGDRVPVPQVPVAPGPAVVGSLEGNQHSPCEVRGGSGDVGAWEASSEADPQGSRPEPQRRITVGSASTGVESVWQPTFTLGASILASIQVVRGAARAPEAPPCALPAGGTTVTANPLYAEPGNNTPGGGGNTDATHTRPPSCGLPSPPPPTTSMTILPPGAVPVFSGLRVRMGMWTGVPSAADVSLNATTRRTQYSGECIVMAKAVSDTVHGGMVVLPECSRRRLEPDAVRSSRHVLLYSGLHVVASKEEGEGKAAPALHLYACYSQALLPRAVLVRPVKSSQELRPGALAAPVGHGAVVKMRVVGVDVLLAWNTPVATAALEVLHAAALQLLPPAAVSSSYVATGGVTIAPTGRARAAPSAGGPAGEGGNSGGSDGPKAAGTSSVGVAGAMVVVFSDADSAVGWAAAVRRKVHTLEWPPELLEHELAEEVWAAAPDNAGFGSGYCPVAPSGGSATATTHQLAARQGLPIPAALTAALGSNQSSQASVPSRQPSGPPVPAPARRSRFSGGLTSPSYLASKFLRGGLGVLGSSPVSGGAEGGGGFLGAFNTRRSHDSAQHDGRSRQSYDGDKQQQQGSGGERRSQSRSGTGSGRVLSGVALVEGERALPHRLSHEAGQQHGGATAAPAAAAEAVSQSTSREGGGPAAAAGAGAGDPGGPADTTISSSSSGLRAGAPAVSLPAPRLASLTQPSLRPLKNADITDVSAVCASPWTSRPTPSGDGSDREERSVTIPLRPSPLSSVPALPLHPSAPMPLPLPSQTAFTLPTAQGSEAGGANGTTDTGAGAVQSGVSDGLYRMEVVPGSITSAAGGSGGGLCLRLLFRGLRLRWAVACGPLKGSLVPGDVSGQVSYKGKAFSQAAKLLGKARAGQICATADFARTLPQFLAEELTVPEKSW